jgi:hypothetical protein
VRNKTRPRARILVLPLVTTTLCLFTIISTVSAATPTPPPDLLQNPSFDAGWTRDTFDGSVYTEIYTPEHWVTWWSEAAVPGTTWRYGRPETKVIPRLGPYITPPVRIRSGNGALQQFCRWRLFDAGVYQQVVDLSPGSIVEFGAYGHVWSCDETLEDGPFTCMHDNILLSVGIDPNGGTNPWSTGIHWVSAFSSDVYRLIGPVQAQVGKAGKVTVFLRATASWPVSHNDAYWDDASLTQGGEGAAATLTVQSSTRPTMHPGHAIILTARADRLSPTPTALPEATVTHRPTTTPAATLQPAQLCLLAFEDRDGDTEFTSADIALGNVEITVEEETHSYGRTVSLPASKSCINDLAPGSYVVSLSAHPSGLVPVSERAYRVRLSPNSTGNVAFALARVEQPDSDVNSAPVSYFVAGILGTALLTVAVVLLIVRRGYGR